MITNTKTDENIMCKKQWETKIAKTFSIKLFQGFIKRAISVQNEFLTKKE